jgi:hypothetical protein
MSLQVTMYKRDFSAAVAPPVSPRVLSYSQTVIGGPKQATLELTADRKVLLEYLNKLRVPVEFTDERGQKVWWGYIADVSLQVGAVTVGVSLDTMSNKIAIVYSLVTPGTATVGTRAITAWATDTASVAQYGTKELLASISGATAAQAEQARDIFLAQKKYPIPTVALADQNEGKATIHCRGWWDTLGWRQYANAGTTSVATTTQISAIVTACGEFLTATDIYNVSGITSSEYRDGDTTALAEILDLLKAGTTSGARLLSKVTQERQVRVYSEPLISAYKYILNRDGALTTVTSDTLLDKKLCPVGEWVRVQDMVDYDMGLIADPSYFFIEEAEYTVSSDSLRILPRGIPNAFDAITQLQESA